MVANGGSLVTEGDPCYSVNRLRGIAPVRSNSAVGHEIEAMEGMR